MVNLLIRHTVADYATFRPVFDAHASFRRANGATGVSQVYRDEGSSNQITAILEWDNVESAPILNRSHAERGDARRRCHQRAGSALPESRIRPRTVKENEPCQSISSKRTMSVKDSRACSKRAAPAGAPPSISCWSRWVAG